MKNILKHVGVALSYCALSVVMLLFAWFIFRVLEGAFGAWAYFSDFYTVSTIAAVLYTLTVYLTQKPICRKLKLGGIPYLISAVLIPAAIFAIIFAAVHFLNNRISMSDDIFEAYLLSLFLCLHLAFSTAATILIELFLFLKSKLNKE